MFRMSSSFAWGAAVRGCPAAARRENWQDKENRSWAPTMHWGVTPARKGG